MATRSPTVTMCPDGALKTVQVVWSGLLQTSSDVGGAVNYTEFTDRSVQLTGTLGTGGQVPIEGSNDGSEWQTLTDADGNDIVLDEIGQIKQVAEVTKYIRPGTTTGDGDTVLNVILIARRN